MWDVVWRIPRFADADAGGWDLLDSDPNMTRVHGGCEAAFLLDRRDSAVFKLMVQLEIYWLRRLCSSYTGEVCI